MNSYTDFASLYDELMNDFDYEAWADYVERIYDKYDIKPKDILEMACGTGNLSFELAKRRYNLVCFDLSEDMLSKAYKKLGKYKNVKLLELNMIDFNINKSFDSVISICDSINYLTNKDELFQCFKNVYKHLKDGGMFIFDVNSFYKLKHIIGNNTFVEDREDIFYTWQNYYDEEENICEFYLTFFKDDGNGRYNRFDEDHMERAYTIDEIIKLLKKAGFSKVEFFNAFTFDNPLETDERINFVAVK
ncbi:class I SAM-dependent methyltransferase [Tissierella creatinini]|nr:class I SAM-dependent methyltransferase [Tissierella creatinini]TJX66688.1 class I SAM-dependent methyltransferase [Soehngenia saccharolytica]